MSATRTCSYCGRENDHAEVLCRECGIGLGSKSQALGATIVWRRVWITLAAFVILGGICLAIAIPIRDERWAHQKAARTSCRARLHVLRIEVLMQTDQTNFSVAQAIAQIRSGPQSKLLQCPATGRPYEINVADEKWLNGDGFADELAIWCRESHAERKCNAINFRGYWVRLTEKQLPPTKGLMERVDRVTKKLRMSERYEASNMRQNIGSQ